VTADDVAGNLGPGEAPGAGETDGDRRVEVAARDVAEGVGTRDDRQAEGKGDADEADLLAREDSRAAAAEDEDEGAERLGAELLGRAGCGQNEPPRKSWIDHANARATGVVAS
jgi:hypothetical protein